MNQNNINQNNILLNNINQNNINQNNINQNNILLNNINQKINNINKKINNNEFINKEYTNYYLEQLDCNLDEFNNYLNNDIDMEELILEKKTIEPFIKHMILYNYYLRYIKTENTTVE